MTETFANDILDCNIKTYIHFSFTLSEIFPVDIVITTPNAPRFHREVNRSCENYLTLFRQQNDFTCQWPTAAHKMPTTVQTLDVHKSVHRDTTTKITNKMHYID